MHLTPQSNAYLEVCHSGLDSMGRGLISAQGTWVWLADHDLDGNSNLDLYSGHGIMSESQGPVWFIGTGT